jgi:hypothetical protein
MEQKDQSTMQDYRLLNDRVVQGKFEAKALSRSELVSNYPSADSKAKECRWLLKEDITAYPEFSSDQVLLDALYNMSLEELVKNTETDGTFRTGALWEGVWTRDISYSILLSLAFLNPEVCKTSLRQKVKNGRIIQDTGTGGAYPVSTDRTVWAIAAWELYLVTGERAWLEEIYPVVKTSLEEDMANAFNPRTNLVKGESSFLDWREQSYPEWMQPADIYQSEALGTNAVHCKAHGILADVAGELGQQEVVEKHREISDKIKKGINQQLWLKNQGYYGQFLYGRNYQILSPRAEALGEALTVLFDIADNDRQKAIIANTPVVPYGIPSIYPQIPDIPSYHNDGIWPFVQAFWSLAAAKVRNSGALTQSLDAFYRAAALFLSNKENYVAGSGDYNGTVKNSDRQLWSVAGNLGMVYKVFFGIDFQKDRLLFRPFVPEKYKGIKKVSGFTYRGARLDLELRGHGAKIRSVELDGKPIPVAAIPAGLQGEHHLQITLMDEERSEGSFNLQENIFSPKTPRVTYDRNELVWEKQDHVQHYLVLRNGEVFGQTDGSKIAIDEQAYGEYQVIAVDAQGIESFASEPLVITPLSSLEVDLAGFVSSPYQKYKGFTGRGYVPVSTGENQKLEFQVDAPDPGDYVLHVVYSNGHGPVNTSDRCAIRTLIRNEVKVGTFVFPQRGEGNWEDWGQSNPIKVRLEEGMNAFTISLQDHNTNMSGDVNEALLDRVIFYKISKG